MSYCCKAAQINALKCAVSEISDSQNVSNQILRPKQIVVIIVLIKLLRNFDAKSVAALSNVSSRRAVEYLFPRYVVSSRFQFYFLFFFFPRYNMRENRRPPKNQAVHDWVVTHVFGTTELDAISSEYRPSISGLSLIGLVIGIGLKIRSRPGSNHHMIVAGRIWFWNFRCLQKRSTCSRCGCRLGRSASTTRSSRCRKKRARGACAAASTRLKHFPFAARYDTDCNWGDQGWSVTKYLYGIRVFQ